MTNTTPAIGDMPPDDFRRYGHQLVDWIADFFERIDDVPVTASMPPGELRTRLPRAAPSMGEAMDTILADIDRVIMPAMTHWNHPANFAYFNSSGSSPGILGEMLTAAFNVNCMTWQSCPAGTELERVTLDWLRDSLGLPSDLWGIIYDTASSASMHAIAAAREQAAGLNVREQGLCGRPEVPRLRLYSSEQAHMSIDKGALTCGIGTKGIRKIPLDESFRMRPELLQQAITQDRSDGWLPFCVVATVGTTSTTAIDPVPEIARICQQEGIWLHVDAAHGGIAAIEPGMRHVLDGCEHADSIVVNPHKWMFVPIDLSAFYTRRPDVLKRAFSLVPDYLKSEHDTEVENYMEYGVPLGRRFRALKLWFVLRYFGAEGLAQRIREHFRLAGMFADWVEEHADFEQLAPVPLTTVCFRAHPRGVDADEQLNSINDRLMNAVNASGRMFITQTKLNGVTVLRLVVSHLRTEEVHVRGAWQLLQDKLDDLMALQ
ncbi:MAG: amino acid decarboxylase [Gemmatimonadota bacterium]|nr:MAG: amino acid decarboxylase [Gemmatimonadota bacterium]